MNRRTPFPKLLALLSVAALLGAQVFGLTRGYLCDCAGLMEWTAQDHCHGPHDAGCHGDETPGHAPGEGDGAQDRRDHQQARADVQLRLAQSVEAPALVPVLVVVFGEEAMGSAHLFPKLSVAAAEVGTDPPPGGALARTTVLLI